MKVARKRPEATNLNHQYAIRRVDICPASIHGTILSASIAPKRLARCDIFHIRRSHRFTTTIFFYTYRSPADDRAIHDHAWTILGPSEGKGRSTTGDDRCDEAKVS